jgi:hypothetical protein
VMTFLLCVNIIKLSYRKDKAYRLSQMQDQCQRPSSIAKARTKTKSRVLANYLPSGKDLSFSIAFSNLSNV